MSNTFCTIITPDHLHYAIALYRSLQAQANSPVNMSVLVVADDVDTIADWHKTEGVTFLSVNLLCADGIGKKIRDKYEQVYMDGFRWAMKPILVNYLIKEASFQRVVYLDSDLYFFEPFEFIWEEMKEARVLLTPHWRTSDPIVNPPGFSLLYNSGLYNAGFIAVRDDATDVMDWWGKVCEYVCEIDPQKGHFADQTHLNLFHILFPGIQVLRHKGCNVANWNRDECRRTSGTNGKVLINEKYPVVFIHFTKSTIVGITNGEDPLLSPYLEQYMLALEQCKPGFDLLQAKGLMDRQSPEDANMPALQKFMDRLSRLWK